MPVIRDSAVVLKRLDWSETSQIIVFLTRQHGKVRAIGKGIKRGTKRRFAVGIDQLEVGELLVSSRQEHGAALANIIEWKQTRSLSGLRETLLRTYGAQYAAEVTGHLTEDWDPHVDLFDALTATLDELTEASEPLGSIVRYQLALLRSVGSLPRFDACVLCGRDEELTYFSSHEGGMVCRHCEPGQVEKWAVAPSTLEMLEASRSRCSGDPGRESARAKARGSGHRKSARAEARGSVVGAFSVLNYHISHVMGREPLLAAKLVPPTRRRIVE